MSPLIPFPQYTVKINGFSDPTLNGYIKELVVDQSIFLPSMFTITYQDSPNITGVFKLVDRMLDLRLGAPVEISTRVADPLTQLPDSRTLINGEITAIEPDFRRDGVVRFTLRGYDRGHRLTIGKKTRAFGGLPAPTVNDMMIVSKIAAENGLIPKVDASPTMYQYMMQYNQSDWDFLWQRARHLGYELYVDDRTLNFVKAGKDRGLKATTLKWGEDLHHFQPRIVSADVVTKVTVKGWDPDKQTEVEGEASSFSGNTEALIPGAAVSGSVQIKLATFSMNGEDFIADPAATSKSIADKRALARMGEHESSFVRASGEAKGDPDLIAGSNVAITGVGLRFSGKYFVTQARHVVREGEYTVHFEVTGRDPYTLHHLLMGDQQASLNKIPGVVIAVVTNVTDLESIGQIKVKYPWMSDANGVLESGWIRVAMPGAGPDRGAFFLPEVNDEVLVAFEQGDINCPVVIGALYSKKNKPPKAPSGTAVAAGKVNQRILRSRAGHVIVLDDSPGGEKIIIKDKSGKNDITISSVDNSVTINGQNKMAIKIGAAGITIESQGPVTIKSASGDIKMEGVNISLKAQANCTVEGTAAVTIKNAAAKVALSGPTVNINNGALEVM